MRDMTQSFLASDRLSLTLRFALGSSQLDDRARDDIQRLVRHITTNDLVNKELLLVGFTDSIGNAGANLALSQQRSNSVYRSLLDALPEGATDGLPIISTGFGELSPLSCNDAANGRRINRRVEVWLRDTVSISN
jgi:phosphate transport system substrate-binding protein